jgi:hypothetical protein
VLRRELGEGARLDELLAQELVLVVGAVEPVDVGGLAELHHVLHPGEEAGVRRRSVRQQRHSIRILPRPPKLDRTGMLSGAT